MFRNDARRRSAPRPAAQSRGKFLPLTVGACPYRRRGSFARSSRNASAARFATGTASTTGVGGWRLLTAAWTATGTGSRSQPSSESASERVDLRALPQKASVANAIDHPGVVACSTPTRTSDGVLVMELTSRARASRSGGRPSDRRGLRYRAGDPGVLEVARTRGGSSTGISSPERVHEHERG